ncbi:MAG: non-canonical purine NTP diphosphatase [Raineya sp.]|nr:non-canonical purine NTP diphosphatase [Raineya sp.]
MKICFATNNQHKIAEVQAILGKTFELVSLAEIGCWEELPETGTTLEANSAQKAEYVWKNYQIPCFADDSGLEVEALNQAPGVYSARYAGVPKNDEKNIALLLQNLQNVENRKAQFRTCITLVTAKGKWQFEGIVKGEILHEKRGSQGFGYDSVFLPEGYLQTFAEMSMQEKNAISHRAIAVKKLVDFLLTHPHIF